MAGALPDNIYRSTEDMSLTSEETANDFDPVGSNATASRLGGTSSTDSRNSGEGNVGLTPTASAYEHATTVLGYDVQEHTNPSTVKIKELSIKYARLMETNERLQAQLIESNTNMVSKQGECSQMHTKLEESNEKIKRLEDENQSSVIENAGVRDELKRAVDMHQTAVKKYTDATNMVSQLQKEKGEIHEQLSRKETECSQKQMTLEGAYEDMDRLESEKQSTVDENAALRNELKRAKDMLSQLQTEKEDTRVELLTQEGHLRQTQTDLTEAQEKIQTLENERQSSVNGAVSIGEADSFDLRNGFINNPVNIKLQQLGLNNL